jgi:hypothetical protein
MTFDPTGMFDCKNIHSYVRIGDGKTLKATKIGKKKLRVLQQDGTFKDIVLDNVKLIPGLYVNLFSITKAMENGWNLSNKGLELRLFKNYQLIKFDKTYKTEGGVTLGVDMIPRGESAHTVMEKNKTLNISKVHKTLGHPNETILRKTAKYYGVNLSGKLQPCVDCALAKQ